MCGEDVYVEDDESSDVVVAVGAPVLLRVAVWDDVTEGAAVKLDVAVGMELSSQMLPTYTVVVTMGVDGGANPPGDTHVDEMGVGTLPINPSAGAEMVAYATALQYAVPEISVKRFGLDDTDVK